MPADAAGRPDPPTSTYRLQIRAGFDLAAATATLDYLRALGAGAVYCSPLLQSAHGSDHGYDVVDHSRVDEQRGGAHRFAELVAAAHQRGLKVVVDIVPNHMGVADAAQNAAWWDLLRLGQESEYAPWFDVDWSSGRILLPVLGDDVDPATELRVEADALRYYEHAFPLAPDTDVTAPIADVLAAQHYELASYRAADTRQNYRRFFAVTDLAGLRIEDRAVFEATHREIRRWVDELGIDGIRVDHPDGLRDPDGYTRWLRELAPDAWITVEKITEPGESLPAHWPVDGMTGYDALAEVTNIFVDPAGAAALTALQHEFGDSRSWAQHMADGKHLVATTILRAEVLRMARLVPDVPHAADALTELAVQLPVYRTYLPVGSEYLQQAVRAVAEQRPDLTETVTALLPRLTDPADELGARFPQLSGAVMAKGVEDTAYYRYTRLTSLTEVGGDPARFGGTLEDFHAAMRVRLADAPRGMTTLSTHDTKRGEDVRAVIDVLAELPDEWATALRILQFVAPIPNGDLANLVWQAFVGTSRPEPIARERMHDYVEKAMREAADGTGWRDPVDSFESVVHDAVDAGYDDAGLRDVLRSITDQVLPYGLSNALSQKLVQLTMPGVPDVYQGTEVWEDSLVDPDNRRPVDFAAHERLLATLDEAGIPPPVNTSGEAKLWVTTRALRARRDRPELFGDYREVRGTGIAGDHLIGFDRGGAITLATRLPLGLAVAGGWRDTTVSLPEEEYVDALTGRAARGITRVGDLLDTYPVALLLPA